MWIIILIIVVFIIYLFQKDKSEMLEKIDLSGGLQERYNEFVNFFVDKHGFKLRKLTKAEIILELNEPKVKMLVQLIQSFDNVLIHWHSINNFGEVKLNWEFPDKMEQSKMTEKIMNDVVNKQFENMTI